MRTTNAANNKLVCVLLFLFSFFIYAYDLGSFDLWFDEAITANVTKMGWLELIHDRYWSTHSPLYFLIVKVIFVIFEGPFKPWQSEFLLRLPSAIYMSMAVALLFLTLQCFVGTFKSVLTAVLFSMHHSVIEYAQEARPYALLLMFALVHFFGVTRMLSNLVSQPNSEGNSDTNISLGMYKRTAVFGALGAVVTIPLGIIYIIVVELSVLAVIFFFAKKVDWNFWKKRTITILTITLGVMAVFVPMFLYKSGPDWRDRTRPFDIQSIVSVFEPLYFYDLSLIGMSGHITLLVYVTYILCAGILIVAALRKSSIIAVIGLSVFLVLPFSLLFISLFKSFLVERYFLNSLVGLFILTGLGISLEKQKIKIFLASMFVIFFTLFQGSAYIVTKQKIDHKILTNFLVSRNLTEHLIISSTNLLDKQNMFYSGLRLNSVYVRGTKNFEKEITSTIGEGLVVLDHSKKFSNPTQVDNWTLVCAGTVTIYQFAIYGDLRKPGAPKFC